MAPALYQLELGQVGDVLALYHGDPRARSNQWLDMVDAAAVLWRLSLYGIGLGARAARSAADIIPW